MCATLERGCKMRASLVGVEGKLPPSAWTNRVHAPATVYQRMCILWRCPLVWVPRARPQTYHFFGDSRRGNILVLVLVLVLASSPRHHRESRRTEVRSLTPLHHLAPNFRLLSEIPLLPTILRTVSSFFFSSPNSFTLVDPD